MKRLSYIIAATISLVMSSCDMDIVPKGQSTLASTADLELLLNTKTIGERPYLTLGIIVNEGYGNDWTPMDERIAAENTLTAIYLTYNDRADRAALATKDNRYTDIYSNVNYMNVILSKIGGASGDEVRKPMIEAEAKVTRAYNLFLAANIYAKQYDEATVDGERGIAYPDNANVDQKPQLPLKECYEKMLEDCSDENLAKLLDKANVNRITKAGGYAVRASVLFQMKRYDEALTYAEKAIAINNNIEDRSVIVETEQWKLLPSSENNLFYISPLSEMLEYPNWMQMSVEAAALFEPGDFVKDYAVDGGYPYWDAKYGEWDSGIEGCLEASGYDAYCNAWGLTVEHMMYLAAECHIRKGDIQTGLDLVNKVRQFRIHPDSYTPLTASTEKEAMEKLQRAKFIECIGSFWNFFDRKRWNTEEKYRKTITRDLQDCGTFSIAPDSKLWVFPFPLRVMQNNSTFKQNY